jgi:ornithine--oxo-acid transaminase
VHSPLVKEIRGRGLLIGIEMTVPARELAYALLDRGVAAKDTHETVLRIAPPLVIDDEAIDYLIERYREALTSLS